MKNKLRPSLAIVSNYSDEACANATYTQLREKVLSKHFNVVVFDLKSATMMKPRGDAIKVAEEYIDQIAKELPNFDIVNIDCELGLWGDSIEEWERRIVKCCNASNRLIFTMHRVDVDKNLQPIFTDLYSRILLSIRNRSNNKPYYILTHTNKDTRTLKHFHGLMNVSDYPVCYLTHEEKQNYLKTANPQKWKQKHGFEEKDVLIGSFGVLSAYKDHKTLIKALECLPDNYKLIFFGGTHYSEIKPFKIPSNIETLIKFLEDRKVLGNDITKRIKFYGIMDNPTFYEAMANVDFVVVPHFECGQSASGITSLALEMGKKLITTCNFTFLEYKKYYPNSFEMFDIGNYFELRDKILNFDTKKQKNALQNINKYTPEGLALEYMRLYEFLYSSAYENQYVPGKLETFMSLPFPHNFSNHGSSIDDAQAQLNAIYISRARKFIQLFRFIRRKVGI